jgi:hypothetical protein
MRPTTARLIERDTLADYVVTTSGGQTTKNEGHGVTSVPPDYPSFLNAWLMRVARGQGSDYGRWHC